MTRRLGFILLAAFEEAELRVRFQEEKWVGVGCCTYYLWLKHPYPEESVEVICGGLISTGLHSFFTTCWAENCALFC